MCGIAGVYCFGGEMPDAKAIWNAARLMKHRGPDDSGIYEDEKVALGHRRLSIIDLSKKGSQPMATPDKKLWVVFNGEIYNYNEIKGELKAGGAKFESNSDTEVILQAYREWGIDCIKRFNGMFAFALWDRAKMELYLVRDRLGIKPLYYSFFKNKLVFGSEPKAILTYPGFERAVNESAISCYLSYRQVLGGETLFENIHSLMPGHYMKVSGRKHWIEEYWDIPPRQKMREMGEAYYIKRLRELLFGAVKKRMISDVPLGAYLSGGLDSTILVYIMSRLKKDRIRTYSVRFKEQGFDESGYAESAAKRYNTIHRRIEVDSAKYMDALEELICCKDLPLAVPNEVPLYLMSKELKKEITVVLSGEGADEIFAGYGRIYRSPADYKKLKVIQQLPEAARKNIFPGLYRKYGNCSFKSELEHFLFNYSYFPLAEKKLLFNESMRHKIGDDEKVIGLFRKSFEKAGGCYEDKIAYTFEKMHLPGLLLKLDNPTMAASVEGRVPFVDYELVEFAFSIPFKYKLRWKSLLDKCLAIGKSSDDISEVYDTTKYILKKAFESDIPREIVLRRKLGFPVPLNHWLNKELLDYAREKLLCENNKISAYFNIPELRKWIEANTKGEIKPEFGIRLWMLVNLEIWLEKYFQEGK